MCLSHVRKIFLKLFVAAATENTLEKMKEEELRAKFLGSFLGSAVGDALGAPWEGRMMPRNEDIVLVANNMQQLIYTDDTHMTIGVAQSLIENKGFDGKHMAETFVRNYESEPWRGYGPGPPRVFHMIKNGEAWDKAAEKLYAGGSWGNGAAMRVAPVGLLYSHHPQMLRHIAYTSSHITHSHELGKEGAALQAYAVALALNTPSNEEIQAETFLSRLRDFVRHPVYQQKIAQVAELLTVQDKTKVVSALGNGIEAPRSVPTAIYCFLKHPRSLKDAIIYAISLGGDTDTIAAMVGAISGAYLGEDAIPRQWRERLENKDHIESLAEELWRIAVSLIRSRD